MALNLCEKLQTMPLFQGMTRDNLMQIIGQTKFRFETFAPMSIVRGEGTSCDGITMLISGRAVSKAYADDHGYSVEENIEAPYVIQPECFTGLSQHYTRTFTATSECGTITIGKSDIMHISDEFIIFRINLLNIISAKLQKAERKLWHPTPPDTRAHIASFIKAHCLDPIGNKTIRIKMTRLAQEMGTSRLDVSKALNAMKADGVLRFSRGIIFVPALEELS